MPQTKRSKQKPAQPAAVDRKSKESTPVSVVLKHPSPAEIAEQEQCRIRGERYKAYVPQALALKQHCARFAGLEDLDLVCILALADLFAYSDHDDYAVMQHMDNWLGVFFRDVLLSVVHSGSPQEANAQPELLKKSFDEAMYELRDTLTFMHDLTKKLPLSVLERMKSWPAPRGCA